MKEREQPKRLPEPDQPARDAQAVVPPQAIQDARTSTGQADALPSLDELYAMEEDERRLLLNRRYEESLAAVKTEYPDLPDNEAIPLAWLRSWMEPYGIEQFGRAIRDYYRDIFPAAEGNDTSASEAPNPGTAEPPR